MAKPLPDVVVDTSVIIDFLTKQDEQHFTRASWLFERHDEDHRVLLPAIVVTEIAGTGAVGGDHGGQAERLARIETVSRWITDSRYRIAEPTERIARQAAQLAGEYKLKRADATVLATAISWRCETLFTRDNGLLKLAGEFGM